MSISTITIPKAATPTHLSPPELAARWHCSVGNLANLRSEGKGLTYLKLNGGSILYRLADVLDYEAASVVTAVA